MSKLIKYITGLSLALILTIFTIQIGQISGSTESIGLLGFNISLSTATAYSSVYPCDTELGGVCEYGSEWTIGECNKREGSGSAMYPCKKEEVE